MDTNKFHIHIPVENEEELKEILIEFAYTLTGLQQYLKQWKAHHGSYYADRLKYWEAKADALIEKYKVDSGDHKS